MYTILFTIFKHLCSWIEFLVSRAFQLAPGTVFHVEFESAVQNIQIPQPSEKN